MKTLLLILLSLMTSALSAQLWDDKDYKVPASLKPGILDSLPIFRPEGVRMVEVYGNALRYKKPEKLDKGDAYIGRTKFDEKQRLISDETFSLGSYSVVGDRFLGFHTETYDHRYTGEDEMQIDYINTKELTKYTWFYKDSLPQECRFYQGEYPYLRAFWKWEYSEDSLLTGITKFDADTIPLYKSSYSYTDFGKVSQIQTTTVGKKVNFTIFEYNQNQDLINGTFFKKLKYVPRDLYAIQDGAFVRKSSRPISEEDIRADRRVYHYDEKGRLKEKIQFSKSGDRENRVVLSYNSAGMIVSKVYYDSMERGRGIYYNFNEDGDLTSIDSKLIGNKYPNRIYTLDLDSRGNVTTCYFSTRGWAIRLDFEYEYTE